MGSIYLTVVSRVESLAVASLLEADAGAGTRVFPAGSVVLEHLFPARSCERKRHNFVARLSDGEICLGLWLSLRLFDDLWRDDFHLILALRASGEQVVA